MSTCDKRLLKATQRLIELDVDLAIEHTDYPRKVAMRIAFYELEQAVDGCLAPKPPELRKKSL